MIEVIKPGYVNKYETTCPHCSAVLRFEKLDIKTMAFYSNPGKIQTCIICPCCRDTIVLSVDNKMVTQYELVEKKEQIL